MQSYDQKNQEDFEKITEEINAALVIITNDKEQKANISNLANLSGVHRNTISNRKWPVERLKAIKEQRNNESKKQIEDNKNNQQDLSDKLNKSRIESLFWFNKSNEFEDLYQQSLKHTELLRDTRDVLKGEVDGLKKELDKQRQENERLADLLNLVKK